MELKIFLAEILRRFNPIENSPASNRFYEKVRAERRDALRRHGKKCPIRDKAAFWHAAASAGTRWEFD